MDQTAPRTSALYRGKHLRPATARQHRLGGIALATMACHLQAIAAPGWNPAPPMLEARAQHAGVLLDDGSVGVINGVNRTGFVSSSERYVGGAWTSMGNAGIQGNVTEAITLGTGQVLARTDGSATARLYDPTTNTWTATGPQTATRGLPTMTLLSDGKVLVAGGSSLSSAEIYDPATRTWTATGSMASARRAHGTVLLRDGRVLVASGFDGSGEVSSAELYDPATGTWSLAAAPLVPRHYASLTMLRDGRALLAGGFTAGGVTPHSEIYDPTANTWTATGAMTRPRSGAMGSPMGSGTVLPSGQVLLSGGSDATRNAQSVGEIYDPATGTWSTGGAMTQGRENGTANLLPSGDVFMTGGYTSNPSLTFYNSAELYTPAVTGGPVPVLNALPSLLQRREAALNLTGSGFTGTGAPELQLQRVENGLIYPVARVAHSATTFTSAPIPTLPAGLYMARIVVDGVPSAARLVRFTDPATNPVATAGNAQATVSWTPPADTRGNPPAAYEVASSPPSAGCTALAPATTCNVTGLANGTAYTFTVHARHLNGLGPESSVSTAVTPTGREYNGPGPITVVLAGGGPTCELVSADTRITAPSAGAPAELTFPYGMFQFRATGCTTGSTLQLAITYPNPLPAGVQFWKYGPAAPAAANTWFAYPGTSLSGDRRTVSYSITDNGVGDGDRTDGVVFDPLGPAVAAGGAGGGVVGVPGLSPVGVALASLLLGAAAMRRRSKAGRGAPR